jgi:anti-anti-sigma regulatory factor
MAIKTWPPAHGSSASSGAPANGRDDIDMKSMSMHPSCGTSPTNVRAIYSLRGRVDDLGIGALHDALADFAANTTGDIVIDCRQLAAICPAGADELLSFHDDMTTSARGVRIRAVPAGCRDAFDSKAMYVLFGGMPSRRRLL